MPRQLLVFFRISTGTAGHYRPHEFNGERGVDLGSESSPITATQLDSIIRKSQARGLPATQGDGHVPL